MVWGLAVPLPRNFLSSENDMQNVLELGLVK